VGEQLASVLLVDQGEDPERKERKARKERRKKKDGFKY